MSSRTAKKIMARPVFAPLVHGVNGVTMRPLHKKPLNQYQRIDRQCLQVLRSHDGTPAVIAEWRRGGPSSTLKKAERFKRNLRIWLNWWYPNEYWVLRIRSIPESWDHRLLYATYLGVLTDAEAQALWEKRAALVTMRKGVRPQPGQGKTEFLRHPPRSK